MPPPQNLEAERAVLGAILQSNDALDHIDDLLPADFYHQAHSAVFEAMRGLAERGHPIDTVTLADELRKMGRFDDCGGTAYLALLDASVPATTSVKRYATIVREQSQLRQVINASQSIARDAAQPSGPVEDFLDDAERRIFDATERRGSTPFKLTAGPNSLVKSVFGKLEHLYERQEEVTGLRTGLERLDRLTAGLQRGDLIIVAGRPSMGKTALAVAIGEFIASGAPVLEVGKWKPTQERQTVAVFSLEMSADSLTQRLFGSIGRVDGHRLRTGKLLDSDWPKLAAAADRLFHSKLAIDDTPGISALQMRAKCRRLRVERGELGLVVVDYLQLMRDNGETREQEIASISRALKSLARELNVPVVALSQLNRSLERREDKRPVLSDLRESGSLEQDADVIAFVYRDEVYNKESPDKGIAEIIIGKQRNGPVDTARVAFMREYTRFENLQES